MAKRFHDTEIWEQDWFSELPNKYKLFWFYIKDRCDNAGFWRPNKSNFQKIIGEPINLDDFIVFINVDKDRIKILPSGRWFIKEFFVFQYGDKFSPTSQVHKGALKTLLQNGIHLSEIFKEGIGNLKNIDIQELKEIAYSKDIDTLNIAYGNPSKRVKDKDKDKDKDILKGGMGENKKGVRFDESIEIVYFGDGSFQELGVDQKILAKNGDINPSTIIKGSIY
jgi:hypothetical protein